MFMKKTKLTLIAIVTIILVALYLQSTAWFRLKLAEFYQDRGQKYKAIATYEKILRKSKIETNNPLFLKGEFTPESPKDFLYIYFIQGKTEELAGLILDAGNKDLLGRLPENYLNSPLYRYYYAIGLAKRDRWQEAKHILQVLSEEYPYLIDFKKAIESIQKKQIPKAEFTIAGIWKFDKKKGNIAEDSSGRGNHGKIQGAKIVEGIDGKALKFDAIDDYVEVARNNSLNFKNFTFSGWIKSLKLHNGLIIRNGREGGHVMVKDNGSFLIGFNNGSGWEVIVRSKYKVGEWTFIVVVLDEGILRCYQDGKLVGKPYDTKNSPAIPLNNLFIGNRGDNLQCFNGIIDEVKIFNRGLSGEEIKQLYQIYSSSLIGDS